MPFIYRLFTILSFICISLPLFAQISPAQQTQVDAVFAKWDKDNMPGGALAVIQNGTIVYQKGYGMANLEHQIPIVPETVFYIGSVSKQFVAMCMLLLEEQGKLDLDVDIRTYLPEFPDYGYAITSRNLIHHTSGIRDNLTLWELIGRSHLDEIPESEIYELILRQEKLNFEPGTEYRYSNSCYFMMSLIIERITGQSLREYADEHIFSKLGMNNSFFGDDNRRIISKRASGYHEKEEGGIENMIMRFDLVGSGGLYSNVQDLFLWDQNFYNNKLGSRGQALIDDMLTNGRYKDGSEVDYAFALVNDEYRGLKTVSHSGALGGYRAHFLQFPDQQFSVIILSNVTTFAPGDKAYAVADILLKDQLEPRPEKSAAVASTTVRVNGPTPNLDDLERYTGRYYSSELDYHYTLEIEKGQVVMKIGEAYTFPLTPATPTLFRMNNGWSIEFQKDGPEKIKGFLLNAGRVSGLRFVRSEE